MKSSIFVKLMLMFCVLAQSAASMPHHHHADSKSICINFIHVLNNSDSNCGDKNDCSSNHHQHSPITACALKHIVTTEPQREQIKVSADESKSLPKVVAKTTNYTLTNVVLPARINTLAPHANWHISPNHSWTEYLSRALPQRAPSCFV